MTSVVQVGPWTLPWAVVLVLLAAAVGHACAAFMGRRAGLDPRPHAWRIFLVAIVSARISFVWRYWHAYADAPAGILDVRDGGWDPQAGIIMAWVYTLVLIGQRPALRKPVLATVGLATTVWIAGMLGSLWMPRDDTRMPSLSLSTFDGSTQQLLSFEGRPTVINLWATWCPPCRREMPALQRAQRENPHIHFVFLNQGESARQVEAFLRENRLDLKNVLLDPRSVAGARFGVMAFPTTLFFDASGKLVDQRLGELSRASLMQKLAALSPPSDPSAAPGKIWK